MVMVSATEMINKAHEGHYAVAAFNINNMEQGLAIMKAAASCEIGSSGLPSAAKAVP